MLTSNTLCKPKLVVIFILTEKGSVLCGTTFTL